MNPPSDAARREAEDIQDMLDACYGKDGKFAKDGGWDNAAMAKVCRAYFTVAARAWEEGLRAGKLKNLDPRLAKTNPYLTKREEE